MEQVPHGASAAVLLGYAESLLDLRHTASAITRFDDAEGAGADADRCAAGRWQAHMLLGNLSAAWLESDRIRFRGAPDPHRFWNGEPIRNKRVIVRCLHGLGDAVQMLRYLPLLHAQCAKVIVEVPPRLLPLATCFPGADHVLTWGEQAPAEPPVWDVQIEVMELPYLFRTAMTDLPVALRYVHLPRAVVKETAVLMETSQATLKVRKAARVGVVWSASEWDSTRRLPMACLARLMAVPGIEFWNLQGGNAYEEAKEEPALRETCDAAFLRDGLLPLAAAISNLDLVITVDTLAAHLAGALGIKAWVLLQHRADWRWMQDREDSPWYPTLRLFRQTRRDDWHSLTTHICEELEKWKVR